MTTADLFIVFGPLIAYCIGVGIAFGCHSYAVYKGYVE
jgi:xanthine/uracil/vitamin C permease (AzgA family)